MAHGSPARAVLDNDFGAFIFHLKLTLAATPKHATGGAAVAMADTKLGAGAGDGLVFNIEGTV